MTKMTFGKYGPVYADNNGQRERVTEGQEIKEIAKQDPDYLKWLLENALDPDKEGTLKDGRSYGEANQAVRDEIELALNDKEPREEAQGFGEDFSEIPF